MKILTTLLLSILLTTFLDAQTLPFFEIHGHRGARGLMPENTIPAFITALDEGVTAVEMDVVITRDQHVILSHEPWISNQICLDPSGHPMPIDQEEKNNIYTMTYEQVQQFDCGSKRNESFPRQQKKRLVKPLLRDVIIAIEDHIKSITQYEVDYNIEIKTVIGEGTRYHPSPQKFSDIVYHLIDQYIPLHRVIIQSFDLSVLCYWHEKYSEIRLSLLTEQNASIEKNLQNLTFNPTIYSPHYASLNTQDITTLHEKNIKVIPWTVNTLADMLILKGMGVDGFITDYPDSASLFYHTLNLAADD